jgi:hypothetical protein
VITILPVRGRRMTGKFVRMAGRIYANDPHWVSPLTYSARRFMSPRINPYFSEADIDHFVALDSRGVIQGRISTTIDPAYVARHGRVGFFGWFETVHDADVAAGLLEQAEIWARDRGMTRLAGPYSYCSTQEFGLLVDGFDTTPAAFQPHNPPYYADLLASSGYTIGFRTDTYLWTLPGDEAVMREALHRGELAGQRYGLTVRQFDPTRWNAEMGLVYDLFLASFGGSHGMIPMSPPVFDYQAAELKSFLDPRLIRIVLRDGEPIGFSLLMADANEVLAVAHGRLSPGFLLRLPALRRRIQGAVVLMIGARPDAMGLGVGRVLAGEIARVGLGQVGRYRRVHTTWIHQDNWQSRALVKRTGAPPRRSYAVFEKELAR